MDATLFDERIFVTDDDLRPFLKLLEESEASVELAAPVSGPAGTPDLFHRQLAVVIPGRLEETGDATNWVGRLMKLISTFRTKPDAMDITITKQATVLLFVWRED